MQIITDFIVETPAGQLMHISTRNNSEHITNGASSTLVFQGIAECRTTKQVSAWIGDCIPVTDYYGTVLFKATVRAKMVREWDMSKPVGQRLASSKQSKDWEHWYVLNNQAVKKQRGY